MDILKQCIENYKRLMNKDYYIVLENGVQIKTYFAKKHFHHLLGLEKLTDIAQLKLNHQNSATTVFKKIDKGYITYEMLKQSKHISEIEDRLNNFKYMNNLVFEKVVINFDKSKVPSSKLKSTIILYSNKGLYYLHLCLAANDSTNFYPETFLVQYDDYYIKNQTILKIIELKIIENSKVLYNYIDTDSEIAATNE